MLIHGAWLSSQSWENFADYFGDEGFEVTAPEWPRKQGDVEKLRADAGELEGLGLNRDRRPLRVADSCAGRAACADRALVRRPHRRAAARSRPWPCGRRDEPGPAEGD